ncbi:MAG: hypothetical protein KH111_13670 [Bacteroidales bacterium]|nr:hypothetical protein [Bacteroidales bacterium]
MNKLSLLFLIFISLSAFNIKNVEKPDTKREPRSEMPRKHQPFIIAVDPESGILNTIEGPQVSFHVFYSSYPAPTITVLRGDKIQENTERFIIQNDPDHDRVTFIIKNVCTEDAGTYEIQITNSEGTDSTAIIIKVTKQNTR